MYEFLATIPTDVLGRTTQEVVDILNQSEETYEDKYLYETRASEGVLNSDIDLTLYYISNDDDGASISFILEELFAALGLTDNVKVYHDEIEFKRFYLGYWAEIYSEDK